MSSNDLKVRILGTVTRLREDGARVTVPQASYTMREHSLDHYEFSGERLPTFALTLREVATYMQAEMKIIEGHWP